MAVDSELPGHVEGSYALCWKKLCQLNKTASALFFKWFFFIDSWGICIHLRRDERLFWEKDKIKQHVQVGFFIPLEDFTIWIVCSEQGFFISYIIHNLL